MNYSLALHPTNIIRPSVRQRTVLLLLLSLAFWLSCAVSLAPGISRAAAPTSHASYCYCPHCAGGANCCCRLSANCPMPQ